MPIPLPPPAPPSPRPSRLRKLAPTLRSGVLPCLVSVAALVSLAGLAACSAPVITPERIAKIEVRNLTAAEKMMEGDEVRKLLEGAQCHEGDVKWRGGYPATLYLDNGRDLEVDGFSYYERVLRVSRKQWCEIGETQWKAVFGELLVP